MLGSNFPCNFSTFRLGGRHVNAIELIEQLCYEVLSARLEQEHLSCLKGLILQPVT